MGYNNEPVMPDKYLMPDGSITTFAGVEVFPADDDRADIYKRMQWQAAKWLMPDGSVVAAIPISTDALDAIYVPLTRKINNKALSADITLTADDLGIPDPLIYKGIIDCATSPNYPAADAGHLYIVSVAGKIGGASGIVVAVGDTLICKTDSSAAGTQAAVGANWNVLEKNQDFSNITITGGTIDGVILRWAKGADIASATTTNLANATGNVIDITGTTTIEGFGTVAAGATFMLRFTGALTLTYNATSMILPGARSITTEAGDCATFVSLGSGNWLCQEFLKANGRCLGIQPVITVSSSRNISAFEMCGQTLVVTGAYTLSLPSAEVGNKCTIVASTAAVYSVDVAVGTDVIVLNGTALTAGNKVTSDGTINNEMEIECRIAGRYHIKSTVNLAIDGGA